MTSELSTYETETNSLPHDLQIRLTLKTFIDFTEGWETFLLEMATYINIAQRKLASFVLAIEFWKWKFFIF